MRELRFAVGSPAGPQAGIWRIWTNRKGDVYLAPRLPARNYKLSLHVSGDWRFAYLGCLADQERAAGRPRAALTWRRPPASADGTTRAIEILVHETEVVTPAQPGSDASSISWIRPPAPGFVSVLRIRLAPRGISLSGTGVLGPLDAGRELVWIECVERRETREGRARAEGGRADMMGRVERFPGVTHPLAPRAFVLAKRGASVPWIYDVVLPQPNRAAYRRAKKGRAARKRPD